MARPVLNVLDLFAGLGGWSNPWRARGHNVITIDNDERFGCTYTADVMEPLMLPWSPDVILASPPCEKFSVMAFGKHWEPGYRPKHDGTLTAISLVRRTVALIETFRPAYFVVENPVGMLRKLDLIPYERRTVTYCRYGARYRKGTDLWGGFPPSLALHPPCRNYARCHVPAPRGSRTGVQGPEGAAERAKIPEALALAVCIAAERDSEAGRFLPADYSGRLFA